MRQKLYAAMEKLGIIRAREAARRAVSANCMRRNAAAIRGSGPIRVAFLVYEPGMWDKQEPVYLEMLERSEFEPWLVVVPDVGGTEEVQRKKREFFLNNYKNVEIYGEDTLKKFQNGHYSYVFYETPYNFKYPRPIQPHRLVRHAKLCYIPYGYTGAKEFMDFVSRGNFYDHIMFGFMDSPMMEAVMREKFPRSCQHFEFLGYPSFERYLDSRESPSETVKHVLWAPRWSYAETGGGSHFLEYRDAFTKLAGGGELSLTIRPHPLMFPTMLSQGLMSEEEIAAYRKTLNDAGIRLDEHSLLNETLQKADVLVADYSAILISYMLSGRPLVYCRGNFRMQGLYRDMYEASYVADCWEDVERILSDLQKGIDPLREKRQALVEAEREKHAGAAKRIADRICSDYRSGT